MYGPMADGLRRPLPRRRPRLPGPRQRRPDRPTTTSAGTAWRSTSSPSSITSAAVRSPGSATRSAAASLCSPSASGPARSRSLFLFEPIVFPDDVVVRRAEPAWPARPAAAAARSRRGPTPWPATPSRPPLSLMRPDVLGDLRPRRVRRPARRVGRPGLRARRRGPHVRGGDQGPHVDDRRRSARPSPSPSATTRRARTRPASAPAIVAALPNAELLVRPELGHLGPFEDPAGRRRVGPRAPPYLTVPDLGDPVLLGVVGPQPSAARGLAGLLLGAP